MDLPARPTVQAESRADPRPLSGALGGRIAASRRLRRVLRREALDPSQHPTEAPKPGGDGQLVEHEYGRQGALCYLAGWDVKHARIFDRCAPKDGIEPFDQLVEQFMSTKHYNKAQRVFVIVDNGSAHRGQRSIDRLQSTWNNLILVHTPVHASWLNQAEIYFSIVQRKALQPNNFTDLDTLEDHLLNFGRRYQRIAQPFEWKFTRQDLDRVLNKLDPPQISHQLAA
jgi:DDE superfamily endonuclease